MAKSKEAGQGGPQPKDRGNGKEAKILLDAKRKEVALKIKGVDSKSKDVVAKAKDTAIKAKDANSKDDPPCTKA